MIYFIQDQTTLLIKIGFTDGDPLNRLAALQTGNPSGLVLLHTLPGGKTAEADLHARFASARERGEWFRPVPDMLLELMRPTDAGWSIEHVAENLEAYRDCIRDECYSDSRDIAQGQLCAALDCTEEWLDDVIGVTAADLECPCRGGLVRRVYFAGSKGRRDVILQCDACHASYAVSELAAAWAPST